MLLTIEINPDETFEIKTHGNTYALRKNDSRWVLACRSSGGDVAPLSASPFEALGCAVKSLSKYYENANKKKLGMKPGM